MNYNIFTRLLYRHKQLPGIYSMDLGKTKYDLKMVVLSKIPIGWRCRVVKLRRV